MKISTLLFFDVVTSLSFILMAVFFITTALKSLLTRRPLIMNSRWNFGFVCLAIFPAFLNSFVAFSCKGISMLTWIIIPLMFAVIPVICWIQMKGYMAFAISDAGFREVLRSTIASLGYTCEEIKADNRYLRIGSKSRLRIKETGEELQVHQRWGTAQFKSVGKSSPETLRKIAKGMSDYFQNAQGKINYITSYFYLICGGFAIIFSIALFMIKKHA